MERKKRKSIIVKTVILALTFAFASSASVSFVKARHTYDMVYPSPALTEIRRLSDYNKNLKNSYLDTPIFVFDSGIPGPTVLYIGGTHPNEVASILSAYIIIENLELENGRVLVIPVINKSGNSSPTLGYSYPEKYTVGDRSFKVGGRLISPLDSWPDPALYVHYPSYLHLSSDEIRNVNRIYPGRENGSPGEMLGYAVMNLLDKEKVDIAFDIHEASVTYPVNRNIVTNEASSDIAFLSSMMLEEEGITMAVELSLPSNYGYSHQEWGKIGNVHPFLIEVPTPFIDRITGAMTESLIQGQDTFLPKVSAKGFSKINYTEEGISLEERVGTQLSTAKMIIDVAGMMDEKLWISLSFPTLSSFKENGLAYYLDRKEQEAVLVK